MRGNGDFISREAAIDDICSRLNWSDLEGNPIPQKDIRAYIADLINHVPAADVRPVVRGFNVDKDYPSLFECSVCGWSDGDTTTGDTRTYNFCPNCGADMRGEAE